VTKGERERLEILLDARQVAGLHGMKSKHIAPLCLDPHQSTMLAIINLHFAHRFSSSV
jgi:hypothetical protein